MKYQQIIIGVIIIANIGCNSNKPIEIDYCKMLTRDQSYVNREELDPVKRESNREKRKEIFIENYDQIIQLTKQKGFPNINFEDLPQDSCKYWAVTATLIHMAQSKPEIFFSEKTISLFKDEMNKGNLEPEDLTPAFRLSFTTNEFCEDLKETINKAVQVWEMKPHVNQEPKFKKCD